MLAIGIALMGEPQLLLVDEPTQFLAPTAVRRVLGALRDLADKRGIAVLLAEVGLAAALRCADRAYVMSNGIHPLRASVFRAPGERADVVVAPLLSASSDN